MDDQLLSLVEAADRLGSTPRTVRDWLWYGKLKGVKVGGRWKVPVSAIEEFLKYPAPHPPRVSPKPAGPLASVDETIKKAGLCFGSMDRDTITREASHHDEFYPPTAEEPGMVIREDEEA